MSKKNVMSKKKIEEMFTYSFYRYAPESFQLSFVKVNQKLSYELKSKLWQTYMTKGKKALDNEIKRLIRRNSVFSPYRTKKHLMTIPLKNSMGFVHNDLFVDRYDIREKLWAYKLLKESLKVNNYNIPTNIQTATLDGEYKILNVEKHQGKVELSKRIHYM